MSVFVDTSAFLAVLSRDDDYHQPAAVVWRELLMAATPLVTSNYVLIETCALIQSRLGSEAIRAFQEDIWPLLKIEWITAPVHCAAMTGLLATPRRKLSLVDCVSFEVMRLAGLDTAFTFDRHFHEQGFVCLPLAPQTCPEPL